MRSLALPAWLVFALGCSSAPLDPVAIEGESGEDAAAREPSAAGDFRPLADYPKGPYGSARGSVIQNHEFIGWADPPAAGYDVARLERVSLSDFYDPRGEEIELIVVNSSAVWCPVCRFEMDVIDSENLAALYRPRKVRLLATLFEDNSGRPAQPVDLSLWGSGLGFAIEFPLVLDPGLKLGPYFADAATPLNLVLDARTMQILEVQMGYSETLWTYVDALLESRGITPPVR